MAALNASAAIQDRIHGVITRAKIAADKNFTSAQSQKEGTWGVLDAEPGFTGM